MAIAMHGNLRALDFAPVPLRFNITNSIL